MRYQFIPLRFTPIYTLIGNGERGMLVGFDGVSGHTMWRTHATSQQEALYCT